MVVKQVMTKKAKYLSPNTTLKQAASTMLRRHIGFLPIGLNGRLIGAITDRDITTRAVAKGWDPKTTTVKKAMSKKVLYCFELDNITKAAKSMEKKGIHRLIVLDNKNAKRMTGILSLSDLAKKGKKFSLCGKTLKSCSKNLH